MVLFSYLLHSPSLPHISGMNASWFRWLVFQSPEPLTLGFNQTQTFCVDSHVLKIRTRGFWGKKGLEEARSSNPVSWRHRHTHSFQITKVLSYFEGPTVFSGHLGISSGSLWEISRFSSASFHGYMLYLSFKLDLFPPKNAPCCIRSDQLTCPSVEDLKTSRWL